MFSYITSSIWLRFYSEFTQWISPNLQISEIYLPCISIKLFTSSRTHLINPKIRKKVIKDPLIIREKAQIQNLEFY